MSRRTPPTRRYLKSVILWCSRWLMGDGEFYEGKVRVEISASEEGEILVVTPKKGMDGLKEPEPLSSAGDSAVSHSDLLRVLLSDDEKKMLRVLAESGPCKAKEVHDKSRVDHSRFYAVWSNLQLRGFVADAVEGDGYVLAVEWVRELLEVGVRPAA